MGPSKKKTSKVSKTWEQASREDNCILNIFFDEFGQSPAADYLQKKDHQVLVKGKIRIRLNPRDGAQRVGNWGCSKT